MDTKSMNAFWKNNWIAKKVLCQEEAIKKLKELAKDMKDELPTIISEAKILLVEKA